MRPIAIVSAALIAVLLVACTDDATPSTVTDVASDSDDGNSSTADTDTGTADARDDTSSEDADVADTDVVADTRTDDAAGDMRDSGPGDDAEADPDSADEGDTVPLDLAEVDPDAAPDMGGPLCVGGSDDAETEPTPDLLVTTLTDVVADDGMLSLREAIEILNTGGAGNVIGFDTSLAGTITLGSTLSIEESMTIVGHDQNDDGAPDIWVDYASAASLLSMVPNEPQSYRFRWLGISGARYGLRVRPLGGANTSLTIEHCEFTDQSHGGADAAVSLEADVDNPTPLSLVVRHSYFHDVDTGVRLDGMTNTVEHAIVIDGCVFENAANDGAAINLNWVTDTTISNTIVAGSADQTYVDLYQQPDARIVNSTIVGTTEVPRLRHRDSSITMDNTVLSGPGADCSILISSNDVVANHSLIGEGQGCTFAGVGNVVGTAGSSVDPMLESLGDYGGGRLSMPPAENSPLIDAGDDDRALGAGDSQLADDVRGLGFPRRCDGDDDETVTVDMGATELQ